MNELKNSKQDKKKSGNDVIDLAKKMKHNDKIIDLTDELVTAADRKEEAVSLSHLIQNETSEEKTETSKDIDVPSEIKPADKKKEEEPTEDIVLDLTGDEEEPEFKHDAATLNLGSPVETVSNLEDDPDLSDDPFKDFMEEPLETDMSESLETKASSYDFLSDADDEEDNDSELDLTILNDPPVSENDPLEPLMNAEKDSSPTPETEENKDEPEISEKVVDDLEVIEDITDKPELVEEVSEQPNTIEEFQEQTTDIENIIDEVSESEESTNQTTEFRVDKVEAHEPLPNLLHLNKPSQETDENDSSFDFANSLGVNIEKDEDKALSESEKSMESVEQAESKELTESIQSKGPTESTEWIEPADIAESTILTDGSKTQSDSLFKIVDTADEIINPVTLSPEQIESALERVLDKMFAERIEKMMHEVIEKAVQKEIEEIKKALIEDL